MLFGAIGKVCQSRNLIPTAGPAALFPSGGKEIIPAPKGQYAFTGPRLTLMGGRIPLDDIEYITDPLNPLVIGGHELQSTHKAGWMVMGGRGGVIIGDKMLLYGISPGKIGS
jgi:hypothetical protein